MLAAEGDDLVGLGALPGAQRDRSGDILAQNLVRHADHRRLLHRRMEMERGLDLERRDVVAAADDQFLRPPGHDQIAILVDEAEVAGLGPAALEALRRRFGIVPVSARMFLPAIEDRKSTRLNYSH